MIIAPISSSANDAVMEVPNIGWPLGLGNLTARIPVVAAAEPPPQPAPARPRRCSSFSSFSSSDLDTESTASFFPDQSVTLGRLIGIQAAAGGSKKEECDEDVGKGVCRNEGSCAPLLHHVIARINTRTRSYVKVSPANGAISSITIAPLDNTCAI